MNANRRLTITVESGYVRAYAHRLDEDGNESLISYGLEGRERDQVSDGVRVLVEQFLANEMPEVAIGHKREAHA